MLMKIYSPEGVMFEVTPVRAKKLTLQNGWTFSPKPQPLFKVDSPLAVVAKVVAPEVSPKAFVEPITVKFKPKVKVYKDTGDDRDS